MAMTELEVYAPGGVTYTPGNPGSLAIGQPALRQSVRVTDFDGGTVDAPGQSVPDDGLALDGFGTGTSPENSHDKSQWAEIVLGGGFFGMPAFIDGGIERALSLQDPDSGDEAMAYELVNVTYETDAEGNDYRNVTVLGWIGTAPLQPGKVYVVLAESRVSPQGGGGTVPAPAYGDLVNAVCFGAGTRIRTPGGWQPVETIRPGMKVITRDHGARPVLWAGQREAGVLAQLLDARLRPIVFAPGALGPGQPERPLLLSRQHRILVPLPSGEGFAPARMFKGRPGIARRDRLAPVTWCHLLLARHEVLEAEGLACESLFPGPMALQMMDPAARAEVSAIVAGLPPFRLARRALRGHELRRWHPARSPARAHQT